MLSKRVLFTMSCMKVVGHSTLAYEFSNSSYLMDFWRFMNRAYFFIWDVLWRDVWIDVVERGCC